MGNEIRTKITITENKNYEPAAPANRAPRNRSQSSNDLRPTSSNSSGDSVVRRTDSNNSCNIPSAYPNIQNNSSARNSINAGDATLRPAGSSGPPPRPDAPRKTQDQIVFDANDRGVPESKKTFMGAGLTKVLLNISFDVNCAGNYIYTQGNSGTTLTNNGTIINDNVSSLQGSQTSINNNNNDQNSVNSSSLLSPSTTQQPITKEFLLLGTDRGIVSLDKDRSYYNDFADNECIYIHDRNCTWMDIHQDTLVTISGNDHPWIYQHNLKAIHNSHTSTSIQNIPSKADGRTFNRLKDKAVNNMGIAKNPHLAKLIKSKSSNIPNTKGVRACTMRTGSANKKTGHREKFLVAALPNQILVLIWSPGHNCFIERNRVNYNLSSTRIASAGINLLIDENKELPICVLNVWQKRQEFIPILSSNNSNDITPSLPSQHNHHQNDQNTFNLHTFDLNDSKESNIIPLECEPLNVTGNWLVRYSNDVYMLAYDNKVKIINSKGQLIKNQKCEFECSFQIEAVVPLEKEFLAFGLHALEGFKFSSGEKTQDLRNDPNKYFRLLTQKGVIYLKSQYTNKPNDPCDIYILVGHVDHSKGIV